MTVHKANDIAMIFMPATIDTVDLTEAITGELDDEQCSCAASLWGRDDYTRVFEFKDNGLVVSCTSIT